MGEFPTISPGDDPLQLLTSARWLNAVSTAASASEAAAAGSGGPDGARQPLLCKIKNTSGVDVPRYGLLGIDAPLFSKTDNEKYFLGPVLQFKGVKPKAEHAGRLAVLLSPCAPNKIVSAVIPCAVQCKVDVTTATHRFASILDDDILKLTSGESGTYPMVPAETGTGEKWAVLFMAGSGGAPSSQLFLARITDGTTGYAGGGIKPAELTSNGSVLKMYKGKARYTVRSIDDPGFGDAGDLAEPENEDATSITWRVEASSGTENYPGDGAKIEVINWVTTSIQVGDRVWLARLTSTKGRDRYFIVARDCG